MPRVKLPHQGRQVTTPSRRHSISRRRAVPFLPRLEALEGRWMPTTVTNLLDNGAGSLRQAILETPAGGTVDFQPGLSGTITLTTGELAIAKDLTIAGPGASALAVSGNNASRVFNIADSFTVAISGLTIAEGRSTSFGGGIMNAGRLVVTACIFSGNSAQGDFAGGGGIYNNRGTVTVTACIFSGNSADFGGGIYSVNGAVSVTASTFSSNSATRDGGGIASAGTLAVDGSIFSNNTVERGDGGGILTGGAGGTVSGSIFTNNSAGGSGVQGRGGGIYNSSILLTITSSVFSGNSTNRSGGGIYNDSRSTLTVTASTLDGNFAPFGGGGISNSTDATLIVTASTLSGNSASDSEFSTGGGIDNHGSLTVIASTLAGNSAGGLGGGISSEIGRPTITASTITGNSARIGGGISLTGQATLRNTIIAGNIGAIPDVAASVMSQGHNPRRGQNCRRGWRR